MIRVILPLCQLPEVSASGFAWHYLHHIAPRSGPVARLVARAYRSLILPHSDWLLSRPLAIKLLRPVMAPIVHFAARAGARSLGVDL
jgi:hypothetical protein